MTLRAAAEPPEEAPPGPAMRELSLAGWYWGGMTVGEAKARLQDAPEGTFLIRDSAHADYLLTISVQTAAGPTNLRIEHRGGQFRLDSVICVRARLKQFDSVVRLIEHYVRACRARGAAGGAPRHGAVHLYLARPLYAAAPSLQHLCRLCINRCTAETRELPLPARLKDYLEEYQYQV